MIGTDVTNHVNPKLSKLIESSEFSTGEMRGTGQGVLVSLYEPTTLASTMLDFSSLINDTEYHAIIDDLGIPRVYFYDGNKAITVMKRWYSHY